MEKKQNNSKETIIDTCISSWKHASESEIKWIQNILKALLKQAKILKWKPTEKPHEYELELAQEVLGSHPDIPIGQLILKKKIKIAFLEQKIPKSGKYRQVIAFPDQGICHRWGIGWLSKETALKQIIIEEDEKKKIWCTIEGLGQNLVKLADETLKFWNKIQWS